MIKKILPLLLFLLSVSVLSAQGGMTEEEVNREKLFIEANSEKLLGNYEKAISMLRELHDVVYVCSPPTTNP